MASLIPGFEYDIFISYRQKDNKYDGWVTGFVDNLRKELEATFKDDVSIYFDINPHDGLLETHDVEASLKDKLKCLVFIPVVSRTYCDPKSFAWEHEFKAFAEQASGDALGLKVKLPNGNIASRILPVRIHDLDEDDIRLCESVLGGFLRGVEFVYKEPGVNRSLNPDDDEKKNLNKTRYRNQINKVANAIKDIISGLKTENTSAVIRKTDSGLPWEEAKKKSKKVKLAIELPKKESRFRYYAILSVFILLTSGVYFIPKLINRDPLEKLRAADNRISVAVMPFQNMTNDTTWNMWQDGIQINLINSLSNAEEIKVRQSQSINGLLESKGLENYATLTPAFARNISRKLEAEVFIYGNINRSGDIIRLSVQLIESKTEEVLKSFQIDGTDAKILQMTDSLSVLLKNSLIITRLQKVNSITLHDNSTNSSEAYRCFIQGQIANNKNDFTAAIDWYKQAMAIDSNLQLMGKISLAFFNMGDMKQAKDWCLRNYQNRDKMTVTDKLWANMNYALLFQTPNEVIKCMNQLNDIDDQNPMTHFNTGDSYLTLMQYDKAIAEFETALEIFKKWGIKPVWNAFYAELGIAYHKTGQYKKEKKLYKKADEDFPDDHGLMDQHAYLALTLKDTAEANRYLDKFIKIGREKSWTEAYIANYIAYIYSMAGNTEKEEEYLRKALELEPGKPGRMIALAYFLIDKERNINEGMQLADKVLESNPEDIGALHVKGWGLYKTGKYPVALTLLQKSWDLRMENSIYKHDAFLHLEQARKSVLSIN